MVRGLLIIGAVVFVCSCSESSKRKPGDAGVDRYLFNFPEAGDLLAPDAAPAGDDRCVGADALKLSDGKATVTGDTSKANNEFGDKVRCGEQFGFTGPQLYYELSMTSSRVYRLQLEPSFDALLYVFSECSQTLINVDCASAGATGDLAAVAAGESGVLTFVPPASGTYRLAVDSADPAQAGGFKLSVEELTAPDHASCKTPQALSLTAGKATVSDSTLGATNEFVEQLQCGLSATLDGPQLYYEVDLTGGTWYRLGLEPSFSATLYVAAAAAGCDPVNIETDCSGLTGTVLPLVPPGGKAATAFRPLASGTYLVVVDSPDPKQAGPFTLTVEQLTPPAGMTCANPLPLTAGAGPTTVTGDTSASLNDLGALVSCNAGTPLVGPQLYYAVDLQEKAYHLQLKPEFPALLGVGPSCASLPIDCASAGVSGDSVSVPAGSIGSLVFTPKTAGQHVILVDSTATSSSGGFTLQLGEQQVPQNGSCTTPQSLALAQSPTQVLGETGPLTNDLTGVDCGDPLGPWPGPQAYYRVTLKGGVQYSVTLLPEATFDPALYAAPAATACTTAAINTACKGFSSDTPGAGVQESLVLAPATDTDYLLVVDSWSASEVGSFTLRLSWP